MEDAKWGYHLAFARHLVVRAGQIAMKHFRQSQPWMKDNRSPVTEADIQVESMIRAEINRRFPDHLFLGEERATGNEVPGNSEFIWITDPIDGTGAFSSGLPVWGVSLALFHATQPVVGVFYQPVTGELFHATEDSEAMFTLRPGAMDEENRNIHVNTDPELTGQSLFLVPSNFHRYFTSDYPGKQRTLGSVAAHLAVVARGAGVASIQAPSLWDIAATSLVLARAGGVLRCLESGQPLSFANFLNGDFRMPWSIAASSDAVFERVRSTLTPRKPDSDVPTC